MYLSFEFECLTKECSLRSRSLYALWLLRRLEANKFNAFSVTLFLIISATPEKTNKQTEEIMRSKFNKVWLLRILSKYI